MALFLGIKLNRIEIYPYGGCSKLEYYINIKLFKELAVLLAGPIFQIIFTYLIYRLKLDVESYFYTYSKFILIFNLIPIYPLDGGRIVNIILSFFISFYNSLKITYYLSYFIYISLLFIVGLYIRNLFFTLIIISLGIELFKEIKKGNLYFNKFLLERCIYSFSFKKIKKIKNIYSMKRDYYHFFIRNNNLIFEKEYLKKARYML